MNRSKCCCSVGMVLLCVLLLVHRAGADSGRAAVTGELKAWHPVTITWTGPNTSETASTNPFLDYRLNVTMTGPSGRRYIVPGHYAADGDAANSAAASGDRWRCRFAPDIAGTWTYRVTFRTGSKVAIDLAATAGRSAGFFDGDTGQFTVDPTDKQGVDFRGKGMLRYVGEHYLRFAETGEWFIKAGTDSPENFLAHRDIDNTPDKHPYTAHVSHWRAGDPTWRHGKGKGIIGALNYLSSVGVNSVYALTMNAPQGDGKDVFMWIDTRTHDRYDTSKLDQWNVVMEHANAMGVQMHLVLCESENDTNVLGWPLTDQWKLYIRELAARFSHNPAIQWNLGEEHVFTTEQMRALSDYIRAQDPYAHPIVSHHRFSAENQTYNGMLGHDSFEGTSLHFQWKARSVYERTLHWRGRSAEHGRNWVVQHDETNPQRIARDRENEAFRKHVFWANLMAGGAGVEFIMEGLLRNDDFTAYAGTWRWMKAGSSFMMDLPLSTLTPSDGLIAPRRELDHALTDGCGVFVVYQADGGSTKLDLRGQDGLYAVRWFDPRNGGALQTGAVRTLRGGDWRSLGEAPNEPQRDWVVLVTRVGAGADDDHERRSIK